MNTSIGPKDKKKSLVAIFVTFGISTLAATILFPVFAHIFLSKEGEYIMQGIPHHYREILLGLFLASFPLAQFLVGPIMGDYSDKKGRRGIFIFSVFLEALGYLVCAFSIHQGILSLLFVGRVITGLAAGNTSVCLASIVDISSGEKEKVKLFGIGSAVIGLMFVIGPLSGGQVAALFKNPIYSLAMPMWLGCAAALLNLFVLIWFFKETNSEKCAHPFDVFGSIHNIQMAFRIGQVRDLYLIYFFFLFSWNMIYLFLPAFLVDNFHMSILKVGTLGSMFGCIWIVGTLFMQKLAQYISAMHKVLFISLVFISFFAIFAAFSTDSIMFLVAIGLIVFVSGGAWPIFTAAISKSAEGHVQGKVLALSQSIQSFSMLLAPLIGGFLLRKGGAMPFVFTAISVLIAAAILVRSGKKPYAFIED
ncbi:MAG: Tetracycline resistance protein, class C [Chlamydiia bacterium]|nr:Tetracycline resistance protein, class C [Chlamydiia bacterium]